jgi:DNA-binding transcriptional LysR family regulator
MRFDRLDLNLLVALDALIEDRSVSQAAKRLYLTQPAVTGALNRLREFFRDDILVPSGRQMLLTPKAEELRSPVREALMFIRSRITTPSSFDPSTAERHFSIAASDNAFAVFVSKVIAAAEKMAPRVTFEILSTGVLTQERFNRGEVDLTVSLAVFLSDVHPTEALYEDEHAVISWSEGAHRNGITEDAFFSSGHAVVVFGADRHPAFAETYFSKQGIERKIHVRVPLFSVLPAAVIGTNRLATMYRRHAEVLASHFPIAIHEPPVPMPKVQQVMQWHSYRSTDQGLNWLLDLVRAEAEALHRREAKGAADL